MVFSNQRDFAVLKELSDRFKKWITLATVLTASLAFIGVGVKSMIQEVEIRLRAEMDEKYSKLSSAIYEKSMTCKDLEHRVEIATLNNRYAYCKEGHRD